MIMTSDGKSTQCFFDPAQTLTFSTPQGEKNLTMGNVVWLAGAGTKKARAKGSTSLVSGTLADVGITCYASAKDRDAGKGKTIQSGAAIFVYTDDVEVKKKRSLTIEEFAGGRIVTLKEVPAKDFFVELLPENWSSSAQLVGAKYQNSMSNKSALSIGFTLKGDLASLGALTTKPEKGNGRRIVIKIHTSNATMLTSMDAKVFEAAASTIVHKAGAGSPDPARMVEIPVSFEFGKPFYMEFGSQVQAVTGEGNFFVYVEGGQSQNLAGGKLRIVDTVTNVNRLPISLRD